MDNKDIAENKLQMIANTLDIEVAIKRLEQKRRLQEVEMSESLQNIMESLKPVNILKNTIEEVRESTPLKNNLLKVALGLGAGYLSNKLLVGKSAGIVKKALGTALQFGVTYFVSKKSDDDVENQPTKKKSLLKRIFNI